MLTTLFGDKVPTLLEAFNQVTNQRSVEGINKMITLTDKDFENMKKADVHRFHIKHPKCNKSAEFIRDQVMSNINPCYKCNIGSSVCGHLEIHKAYSKIYNSSFSYL